MAIDHWRSYLQMGEFIILTDHHSLMHLSDQRLHTPWQHKAFTKLLGLSYRICYRKGTCNGPADALSRKFQDTEDELCHISACTLTWIQEVTDGYKQDPFSTQLLTELAVNATGRKHFTLNSGLIRFKGRVWIGDNPTLQSKLLTELHSSPIGGHSGFPVTYRKLKQLFAWPKMKKMTKTFVQQCQICLQAKPDRARYPGLLQPLPVPEGAWQVISLDFIEGLPRSDHSNCILVVVDKFSKYAHFLPLSHPFTALSVAKLFMKHIFKLHGLPLVIISDRDKVFTSQLWEHLFEGAGTKLHFSSAYHPQSDAQTERVNQCLEIYLRCFVHSVPTKWAAWLHLAEYWYNTSFHSSVQATPFEVLYGHSPSHFGIGSQDCAIPDLAQWLKERRLMQNLVQQHLHRAQQQMKHFADKKRSFRSFEVGDWVYLKLQPYVQTSVAVRANHKLAFKYFGPYQVTAKIGTVAYQLQLPSSTSIHPVFHVSQLKSAIGFTGPVQHQLPASTAPLQVPLRILDRRLTKRGNSAVAQVLIQWSASVPEDATWEDLDDLRSRFPAALAWGQANSQGEGLVRDSQDHPGDISQGSTAEEPEEEEGSRPEVADEAGSREDKEEVIQTSGDNQAWVATRRPVRERRPNPKVHGPEWVA
uniref:H0502G05.7 protein n=1 Tax=Oryza sativa TaxID=4530 RepID=Q01JF9_ORYSA|nr:H0502G05.7 [Oryza sativa]